MNSQDQSSVSDCHFRKQSHEQSETNDISQLREQFSIDTSQFMLFQIEAKSRKYWSRYIFKKILIESERKKQEKSNLSMELAKRMPKNIQGQVIKMIEYYEGHLSDQLELIHRLVTENKEMKKKLEDDSSEKQNRVSKQNIVESKFDFEKVNSQRNQRIDNLERSLLDKNKQIGELNKEITNLYAQVKKYKKRIHEMEAKSPVKPNRSKSPIDSHQNN